jgi:apolipoprotein N-acyltransferase
VPRQRALAFPPACGKLRAVKSASWRSFGRSPALWAALAGALWAAAFPNIGWPVAAWLAPGALLVCGLVEPRRAFRSGYIGGFVFHLIALHWLLLIPVTFAPVVGWVLLSAYLALFPAVWTWMCVRLWPRARRAPGNQGAKENLPSAAGFPQRALWALSCGAVWVALELGQGRLLSGFPWNFLGASQYAQLPLLQLASVTGVPGVSFVMVWFSAALVSGMMRWARPSRPPRLMALVDDLILPLLAVGIIVTAGFWRIAREPRAGRFLTAALVQPSIPQTLIWDPGAAAGRFEKLLELTDLALKTRPDVLIWPEAALPPIDEAQFQRVAGLIRSNRVWFVFGADDAEERPAGAGASERHYFNSAFLMNPEGRVVATYRKQRLVIFGEYIPLVRWLPFLKWFTPIEGGFTPGEGPVEFDLGPLRARVALSICFEDVFGFFTRRSVTEATDFILNLTNNGWFGEGAAQWQHATSALFRAVENGVPLVRCTNNGLTCWIDRLGRMHEVGFGDSPDIYAAGFKTARIPLWEAGARPAPTFYRRYGDWFGWICVGMALVLAGRVGLRRPEEASGLASGS